MSLSETVFNRSTIKLVVALAIPSSIGFFFWFSEREATRQIDEYKAMQKANPHSDDIVIKDYTMKEVDDTNRVRWLLSSKTGTIIANGQDVALTGVVVQYFDPTTKALKMKMSAPQGTANQTTKLVKLKGDKTGKVLAEGEGGKSKFTANSVELTKKNQFVATGGVIIDWPGVAKVSGDSASGSTNMAAGPKDLKIVGNTHAEIAVR
jgi:LPS export ABC transporter protein LptC